MLTIDRVEIVATARSWLGTSWTHQGRLKNVGVDCGGLIIGIGKETDLLDFDTSAYGRIPDGQKLRALCNEHLVAKPISDIVPGDVLLMRFTRHPRHLAIVGDSGDPFSLIHAYADAGRCVEHSADPKWRRRIVAAYSFKPQKT